MKKCSVQRISENEFAITVDSTTKIVNCYLQSELILNCKELTLTFVAIITYSLITPF